MEKDAVVKIRDTFRKATFTMTSRKDGSKVTFRPILHIVLDNSVNIYSTDAEFIDVDGVDHKNISTVVWDDENELIWWFKANTPSSSINSPSSSMSFGHKSDFPLLIIGSAFSEIQNMRIICNEEAFENFCDELGEDVVSKEQRENIYRSIFEETDQYTIITRKREVNYNTEKLKKYDPVYDEDSAYIITNHSDQGGAV